MCSACTFAALKDFHGPQWLGVVLFVALVAAIIWAAKKLFDT